MDKQHARELVAGERRRIEAALADLTAEVNDENASHGDQSGEASESGADLQSQMTDDAVIAGLREDLAAVERAEERIAAGTYGRSIESGDAIPVARLEVKPLAERTVEEQERYEHDRG